MCSQLLSIALHARMRVPGVPASAGGSASGSPDIKS
jgi:hypothetical protein